MKCLVTIQVAGGICQAVHIAESRGTKSHVCVVDWDNIIEGDPLPKLFDGVEFSSERDELLFDTRWERRW